MRDLIIPIVSAFVLIAVIAWGRYMRAKSRFKLLKNPKWPEAENPGLAMELAGSGPFADEVLGAANTVMGSANRLILVRVQKLDFVFIPLYTAFFLTVALGFSSERAAWGMAAIFGALLAALFDILEDLAILRLVKRRPGNPPRRFGQLKWLFFFATCGIESFLLFPSELPDIGKTVLIWLFGIALLLAGIGGVIAALRISFDGISAAVKLSGIGLLGLALAPFIRDAPPLVSDIVQYAILLRVPLLIAAVILMLPILAFATPARSLLRGLFDLTPLSMLVVTLAAGAAAGTAAATARIACLHAFERVPGIEQAVHADPNLWLWITLLLSLPLIIAAVIFSARQGHGSFKLVAAAAIGVLALIVVVRYLENNSRELAQSLIPDSIENNLYAWMAGTGLFDGYISIDQFPASDPAWHDHLAALMAFAAALGFYIGLGIYGWLYLGKIRTVPALGSALMVIIMLGWALSSVAFFFDAWHVPLLLIVVAVGVLTAQSRLSDHFYVLKPRANAPVPSPSEALVASKTKRVIVVAANGGGIQAGAWAAQVLTGLQETFGDSFRRSLRLISSVSGGSVGSAAFLYWLADPVNSKDAAHAAAESSLDEVAWGLGWPDLSRALIPWVAGPLIGRGRALEKAWCMNSAKDLSKPCALEEPLSKWNDKVASGELPAVVMNATISETGERLLLMTTRLDNPTTGGRARVDAADLHHINGQWLDVGIVTAARLSATFAYVTPASRAKAPGPQPHVVDGGYYDNFGTATLVEWLDEALTGIKDEVESVLVLQIHGAKVVEDLREERHAKSRGWFYQAIAPISTLANVRGAGQAAHSDIEIELLQNKWKATLPIHNVKFEFPDQHAPLSWHLTPSEQNAIKDAWREKMGPCVTQVKEFLAGSDQIGCGCPRCRPPGQRAHAGGK